MNGYMILGGIKDEDFTALHQQVQTHQSDLNIIWPTLIVLVVANLLLFSGISQVAAKRISP